MLISLTLDEFTFDGAFECPQVIPGGGAQSLNVHKEIGGVRQIDAMGRDDADIQWNGTFTGISAEDRVKFLNNWRVEANSHILAYSTFQFSVVIKDFTWKFKPNYFIDYQITCTVVDDLTQPVNILVPAAFNDTVLNDLLFALNLAELIANPSISSALGILNAAISNLPGAAGYTDLAAVAAAAQASIDAVNQLTSTFNTGNNNFLQSNLDASRYADTLSFANEIKALEVSEAKAANAIQLQFTLLRILKNTQVALTSTGTTTIQVANTDLFHVAQQQYGNWRMYTVIALANQVALKNTDGLPDYFISGVKTLIIPPKPAQVITDITPYA